MYCFANNLPLVEERAMAEAAVERGIGQRAAEVQYYSIVAAQDNDIWQVQITFREHLHRAPMFVDINGADHSADAIEHRVKEALQAPLYYSSLLGLISRALAIRKSALVEELKHATSPPPTDEEIQAALTVLQKNDLVGTRRVGDEEIYAITAKGVQLAAERLQPDSLLSF